MDHGDLVLELIGKTDERNHDFRNHFNRLLQLVASSCGLEDGTCLHFGDFRIGDTKTATAVAKHRVGLVERVHSVRDHIDIHAKGVGQFALGRFIVREEFMQRRIEEAHCHR